MLRPPRLRAGEQIVRIAPSELNAALADPAIRALHVTADHTCLDELDVEAVRRDPKPILGAGGTTFVHLELWRRCGLAGFHGDDADLSRAEPTRLNAAAGVRVPGQASGPLLGGSLGAVRAMIGAGLPDLTGAILLLTGERTQGLGQVDRQLTHLRRAGILDRVAGIAVGTITGFDGFVDRGWSLADVLTDQLGGLSVPVLGGLPTGPGGTALPLGPHADLDATAGTLVVAAGLTD